MKNNTILVTGGAGFIGSHTVDLLINEGFKVIVVDRAVALYCNSEAKYYQIDINSEYFENVFKENNIDYIIHLAAQPSVSYSTEHPIDDANDNILASIRVFGYAKKYNVKKVIVSSSAALYANPQYFPIDENHPISCISPYGISKYAMEEYLKISGLNYIIFRFANVFGPRQNSKGEAGVIAIFTDNMVNDKEITIHGSGNQIRDFIFVKDVASALFKAIVSDVINETINISSNTETSINTLYEELKKISKYSKLAIYTTSRNGDIEKSILDNRKANKLLGWQNQTSFVEALQKTVNFFNKKDM